jgi:cystathionine beta-lyase/cystathionine gamma-synthase
MTYSKETELLHRPKVKLPEGNEPMVMPIYQTAKFTFPSWAELLENHDKKTGFFYSRTSNPTVRHLENQVAALQGRDDCVALASGMAAVTTALLALLKAGDHVAFAYESYRPARSFVRDTLSRWGITSSLFSVRDPAALEALMATEKPAVVMFEAPSNPVNHVPDIAVLTEIIHRHGALCLLDNTLGGLHVFGEYDVDIFIHSLTKFAGGHSDVMGGAIVGNDDVIAPIKALAPILGPMMDPHAAFLILRGLETYFLRFRHQCSTSQAVAEFLEGHEVVRKVHYPGLPGHPSHALCMQQAGSFGAVVSFDINGGLREAESFVDRLKLFYVSGSLGSVHSLVVPAQPLFASDYDEQTAEMVGVVPGTVRLCIGLESADDLISDLAQALDGVGA